MSLKLGDIAPNFQAGTTIGAIDFHKYLGDSWGLLLSHPADYTPVCTTEIQHQVFSYHQKQACQGELISLL
jgi:alkyl hydroperoxide reductase subunit AhpC